MKKLLLGLLTVIVAGFAAAQPANDNCANASPIVVSNAGYGLGTFTSATADLTSATVQPGETFYSTISAAGENRKSVWYKFSLPTARTCTLTVAQPTPIIPSNDVGFTIYKANGCFPTTNQADSALLAAQSVFGFSTNPCLKPGDYLVQVSSTNNANGPIYVTLQLADPSPAAYDLPTNPYNFGTLSNCQNYVDFATGCQTVQDSNEVCNALPNYRRYTQSVWLTFKAAAYFDWIGIYVGPTAGCCFNNNTRATFAYNLYRGDCRTTPLNSLTLVDGCAVDTFNNYDPYFARQYPCGALQYDSSYSIQLFFDKDFADNVRVFVDMLGISPGGGPQPTTGALAPANVLGTLPQGNTNVTDAWGCNTRVSQNSCGQANPATGVRYAPTNGYYNLNDWFTFTIAQPSNVIINVYNGGGNGPVVRLFNTGVTAACSSMDTNNIYAQFSGNTLLKCLPAGDYSMQVLGNESYQPGWYCAWRDNLGQRLYVNFSVAVNQAYNHYSLVSPGAVDTVNRTGGIYGPLQQNTVYNTATDTFGCENTVLPAGTHCYAAASKAVYHQFTIGDADGDLQPDSGVLFIGGSFSWNYWHNANILYQGNADALATVQNAHLYGDSITGLTAATSCMGNNGGCQQTRACVVPGMYTLVTYGDSTLVGQNTSMSVQQQLLRTVHYNAATTEDMGNILDSIATYGGSAFSSSIDHFSCLDNADTIGGQAPCTLANGVRATKAIYRQFYLSAPALVTIASSASYNCSNTGTLSLYYGQASNGLGTLTPVAAPWQCFTNNYTGPCTPMAPGWYTVVAYGEGPTYTNPTTNYSGYHGYGGDIGLENQIRISTTQAPNGPKYNYPYKAAVDSVAGSPFVIQPAPNRGTAATPQTDTTYTLYTENYNCTVDTPFSIHPVNPCTSQYLPQRVTYYVFQLPQMAYVHISSLGGNMAKVYPFDVRTDSALMLTATPVQPCINNGDFIELCRLQAGVYTLVIFPSDGMAGSSITPTIYVDNVGYSRFDHASNAYDFDLIPEDSVWYSGKPGDVNPLNPARAASNDFFYCTTGAQLSDPAPPSCYLQYDSLIYGSTDNIFNWDAARPANYYAQERRNLWYTFVLDHGGYCHVKVNNLTPGKTGQSPLAIYKSNVSGTLPWSNVLSSGQIDSTTTDSLTHVIDNYVYYCSNVNEVTFFRPPCVAIPERYYLVVDNYPWTEPNSQVEVQILYDTIRTTLPLYDHYSEANVINGLNQTAPPYSNTAIDTGTYYGGTDNFTCATQDAPDPNPCNCTQKNLWYKFTVNQAGYIRLRYQINGANVTSVDGCQMSWYKELIPGDSTGNGLVNMGGIGNTFYDNTINAYWYQTCIIPGTYYILMSGCNRTSETVRPVVQLVNAYGDYCSNPVYTPVPAAGVFSMSAIVDCHTIGEGFGEDGTNMGCLIPLGDSVPRYKSTWFKFSINAGDTFDITPVLVDNTNVPADQIRYRLLYGSCSAMNPGSCFVTANTVNTFNCLGEGTYYIQVVEPHHQLGYPYGLVTGNITINVNAVQSQPGCVPATNCFAIAGFTTTTNCSNDSIYFVNQSSSGDSIVYAWNFGYNNLTSTLKNPVVLYPLPADSQSYTVTLITTNLTCNKGDTLTIPVAVYRKQQVFIGNDTTICSPDTLVLNPNSFFGTTYLWQDGNTGAVYNAATAGQYWVAATFQGCTVRDTMNLNANQGPVVNLGPDKILCPGIPYTVTFSNASGETYLWSDNSTSNTFTTSTPGTYWVHSVLGSCVKDDTVTLTSAATIAPLGNDTIICLANSTIILDGTVAGATAYTWDDATTNTTRPVTVAGTYWVDVTINGCVIRDSVVISPAPEPAPVISGDSNLCFVGDSAVITTGNAFTTYLWSNNATTAQTVVFNPATYFVTVTNNLGCAATDSFVVRQSPVIALTSVDSMVSCFGFADGQIQITVGGGTGPFTYNWSNSGTTPTITGLSIGNYTVTVNDVIGCTSTKTDAITQPQPLAILTADSSTLCNGDSTGRLFSAVSGGTPAYTYLWSNGDTNANPVSVPAGGYTVTVTDSHSCTTTASQVVNEPTAVQLSLVDSNVLCYGGSSGKVVSVVSGGTPGYTYLWSNNAQTPVISNLPIGNYALTVTDANSCTDTASTALIQPSAIYLEAVVTNARCFGSSTGSIAVTDTGGTPGYTYLWGGGEQTAVIQNLAAGNYTLTVTDANQCILDTAFTITEPTAVVAVIDSSFDALCFGSADGRMYTSPTGGTGSYTFAWSNGGNTSAITGLTAGSYTVTVSDSLNCTATVSGVINQPQPLTILTADSSTLCNGDSTGRLFSTVSGGTPAYTYSWSNGDTNANPTNVPAGNYTVTVTDSHSCTISATQIVNEPTAVQLSLVDSNVLCYGSNSGKVVSVVSGGTPGYTYLWSNNAQTPVISNLPIGNYALTVTDANGCTDTASTTLIQPSAIYLEAVVANARCFGSSTGSIAVTDTGGTPGYTYLWGGGEQTPAIQNLAAGNYTLTVKDANLCILDTSFTITEPTAVVAAIDSSFDALCFGSADGRMYASATGGTGSYTFAWSNNGNTASITGLTAGSYTVTVSDSLGCTATAAQIINQPDSISLSAVLTNVSCNAAANGAIQLTATGGTVPYTYLWSNSATTANINQLTPGTYAVTVTDKNNCTATLGNLSVTEPPVLDITLTATTEACPGAGNGTVSSTTIGGTPAYTYAWSNNKITPNISGLTAGNYRVTVTDAQNCSDTASADVITEFLLAINPEVTDPYCPPVENGSVILHTTGVTPPYTYNWSGTGAVGDSVFNLAPGTYAVTITDNFNCSIDTSFTLQYQFTLSVDAPPAISIKLGSDTLIATTTNGTNVHYDWSPSESLSCTDCANPLASPSSTTEYVVVATDDNNCVATDSVTIYVTANYDLFIPNSFTPNGDGTNDYFEIFGNKQAVTFFSIAIFNRWGEKVYESNDVNFKWDGEYKGSAVMPSVLVYQLRATFINGHTEELRKGSVTLIR